MVALGTRLATTAPPRAIVHLEGELGAGKTTLVRGLIRALGHEGAVKSPTYTLVEGYEIGGRRIYHLDLYRLADAEELEFLGLRDWLAEEALLLVEWPSRGEGVLPEADLRISIEYAGQGRRVAVEAGSAVGEAWLERLERG